MNISSLGSLSLSISKPFHCLPLTNKQQRPPHHMQFRSFSCRASKLKSEDETTHGNFYKILSLTPKTATMDEVKRAYRSMALRYHPDVCHDPSMKEQSTKMFVQLNAAYKTLSSPTLRAEYDCKLGVRSKESVTDADERWRSVWKEQVVELKRRSHRLTGQKGES